MSGTVGPRRSTIFSNTKSIALDGVDDEVSMDFTNTSSTGSISVWIKPTDYTTGSQSICIYTSGGYRDYIMLQSQNTGGIRAVSADNGGTQWDIRTNTGHLTNGVWTHICFVFNGTSGTFYINGNSVTATYFNTTNTSWWWDDLLPTKQRLGIFRVNGYNTSLRYNGNIEEQSVFTTALSSTEVSAIYNNGLPTDLSSQSNILAWYRCGDGDTAPILTDNIGSNDGTMTNFSAFSTDVPTIFSNTKSIALDGVDDFVTMGNVLNMADDGTDSFSCSFWMKRNSFSTEMIVSKQLNSGSYNGFAIYIVQGRLTFFIGSGTSPDSKISGRSTNYVIGSTWNNVILTYDGSQDISGFNVYINGVSDSVVTLSNNTPTKVSNTTDFRLSGRGGGTALVYGGGLDEVAFWNGTELTSTQANEIGSTLPADLSTYNPTSWWRCGDGDTSPILTDNGSGGNNGTMTNFSTFSTDVPT